MARRVAPTKKPTTRASTASTEAVSLDRETTYSVQVLDRAFGILTLLAEKPRRVAELAAELHLHRSTVFRLLSNLEQFGFARKDAVLSSYSLGPEFVRLGAIALREELPLHLLRPVLVELTHETGLTSQLWIRDGLEALFVDQTESSRDVRVVGRVGSRLPLNYGAVSKVLLAFGPPSVLDQLLSQPLPSEKPGATTSSTALVAELEAIRLDGYAVSESAVRSGCKFLAAPAFGALGWATASVCILGTEGEIHDGNLAELARKVRTASRALSLILGHGSPAD